MIRNTKQEYLINKKNFLTAKIKGCKKFFETNDYKLEQAYCEIILDNLKGAEKIFREIL